MIRLSHDADGWLGTRKYGSAVLAQISFGWGSSRMGAAREKPKSVAARLVICDESSRDPDEVVKSFISEWLVPTLVEDYLRSHQLGPEEYWRQTIESNLPETGTDD